MLPRLRVVHGVSARKLERRRGTGSMALPQFMLAMCGSHSPQSVASTASGTSGEPGSSGGDNG